MKLRKLFVLVLVAALAVPVISITTASAQDVVTITFWDNQQSESGLSQYQQAAVDLFEQSHPNIKVDVVTIPYTEYQDRLVIAVRGGTPPDVSTVDQIWNYGFATGGAIIPLDDYIASSDMIKEENFFPGAWASAAFEDQVWGIPFNIDVWQFTFYNKTLLDAAGVDPQSLVTWDGLKAAGEALTDSANGKYGIGLFAHLGEDTVVIMNSFVYSNGGSVLAADGSCALDQPEAVEALEYLASLLPYAPEGAANNDSGGMRELFLNGSLATEWWPALEQPTLFNSDLDWDFVNGTAPEGKTPVGTLGGWNLGGLRQVAAPGRSLAVHRVHDQPGDQRAGGGPDPRQHRGRDEVPARQPQGPGSHSGTPEQRASASVVAGIPASFNYRAGDDAGHCYRHVG